jgi:hypothetical protein
MARISFVIMQLTVARRAIQDFVNPKKPEGHLGFTRFSYLAVDVHEVCLLILD